MTGVIEQAKTDRKADELREQDRLLRRVAWSPGLTARELHATLFETPYGLNATERRLVQMREVEWVSDTDGHWVATDAGRERIRTNRRDAKVPGLGPMTPRKPPAPVPPPTPVEKPKPRTVAEEKHALMAALRGGPMTTAELADFLGVPKKTAWTRLTFLQKGGKVTKESSGRRAPVTWTLVAETSHAEPLPPDEGPELTPLRRPEEAPVPATLSVLETLRADLARSVEREKKFTTLANKASQRVLVLRDAIEALESMESLDGDLKEAA